MAIYVSESEFEVLEPGVYYARCCDVTDLGRVKTVWEGEERNVRKVRITFLVNARDSHGNPFYVRRDFTIILSPKAALTKVLESWRNKAFTPEERKRFDLEVLIGVPARLVIVNAVSKSTGKLWANIENILPLPKGAQAPILEPDFVRVQDRPNYKPPPPDPKSAAQIAKEAAEEQRRLADFINDNDLPADGAYELKLPAVGDASKADEPAAEEPVAVAAGEFVADDEDVPF